MAENSFLPPEPVPTDDDHGPQSDAFPVGPLQLLFTRNEELVLAERKAPGAPFVTSQVLSDLNSDEDDRDTWASADLDYVVFSSNRSGSYLLYEARRTQKQ